MPEFTHLHVHSHYSMLDGLPKIEEILDHVEKNDMDAVALTDHGVLYGLIEFYQKAKERGIKPILGVEAYVAPNGMKNKRSKADKKNYHLTLLCENNEGYHNLIKLITKAHLEGFYYKPRIDLELLREYADGLIGLSGCIQGEVPQLIVAGNKKKAIKKAKEYNEIFGQGNFYLELQHHPGNNEQDKANEGLKEISKKEDIPVVATRDSHYLKKDDDKTQDILVAIQTGATIHDKDRLTVEDYDLSMSPPEEMKEHFQDTPEAIKNTQRIKEKCNVELDFDTIHLPKFEVPEGETAHSYLKKLIREGIEKRYGKVEKLKEERPEFLEEVKQRLDKELSVIKETGYSSYFLIVQDFVNWAKDQGIVVGPGRGSAAGSLVSYLINITNVDPLEHDLIFERFLNPERVSMPDIDIDFADDRRDEVIEYSRQKYGEDHVAQIITFGKIAARMAIRDVGRSLGYSYDFCDVIAKLIPFGDTIEEALEDTPELKERYEQEEKVEKLIDFSKQLEGVARHASTHACGVVITREPLTEYVPLQRASSDDESIVTQYEMHAVENLGLLKMDFLGLKNLTIIQRTLDIVENTRGEEVDLEEVPQDDEEAFEVFQEGATSGIFQFESRGMKRYLKQLKPSEFDDLVAMVALYRPGPMELIPDYIKRKHGEEEIEYEHPDLEPILKDTYGIAVYQEQLLEIARQLGGFSYGEADVLRKAIGKKIPELLEEQKNKLIKGMKENGIEQESAETIWEFVEPFARYGFNRCLTGDTKIPSPTGKTRTVRELYEESKKNRSFRNTGKSVVALDEKDLNLKRDKITNIEKNGKKKVYKIKTTAGREIKASENHRFRTFNGWKKMQNINENERLALPRRMPIDKQSKVNWPHHKLSVLGYVLSEGNTCHPHGFYLYSNDRKIIDEIKKNLEKFQNTKATISKREGNRGNLVVYAGRKNKKQNSEAVEWIQNKLNLRNKNATEKFIPEKAFRLPKYKLALLIGKMWTGDGCIDIERKTIYYATSSKQLARQMQDLLLRFDIFSKLKKKEFNYKNGTKLGWTVSFCGTENIQKFTNSIGQHLSGKRKKDLKKLYNKYPILSQTTNPLTAGGTPDTIPAEVVSTIKKECKKQQVSAQMAARWSGVAERLFYKDKKKKGYKRKTLAKIGESIDSTELKQLGRSDIYWDSIDSIEYVDKKETYDLTTKKYHNFVANGIITHNSHAASYATIAYQTAYLKAHYPVEFMASLLTAEDDDVDEIAFLVDEAERMGIEVLPPNINESLKDFTVSQVEPGKIRFGLSAIKQVGDNLIKAIIEERKKEGPFEDMPDFVERITHKDLNKGSLEALIKVGAFDELDHRGKLLENLERLLEASKEAAQREQNGQASLFEKEQVDHSITLKDAPEPPDEQKLNWEKDLLGLYLSSHPLENYAEEIKEESSHTISDLDQDTRGKIKTGGILSEVKEIRTKNDNPMAFATLESQTAEIELVVFPDTYKKDKSLWTEDNVVLIEGKTQKRDNDDEAKLLVKKAEKIG